MERAVTECLPGMYEVLGLILSPGKIKIKMYRVNFSTLNNQPRQTAKVNNTSHEENANQNLNEKQPHSLYHGKAKQNKITSTLASLGSNERHQSPHLQLLGV